MKFYIATRLSNVAAMQAMRDHIIESGGVLSYDWSAHGMLGPSKFDQWETIAKAEIEGVREADVLILLLPGGRGAHIELGCALGLGKPVFVIGPQEAFDDGSYGYPCLFYHHPLVVARISEEDPDKYGERFDEAWDLWVEERKAKRRAVLKALREG